MPLGLQDPFTFCETLNILNILRKFWKTPSQNFKDFRGFLKFWAGLKIPNILKIFGSPFSIFQDCKACQGFLKF